MKVKPEWRNTNTHTINQCRIFTMAKPICSNLRLSEFRINLFIDNFTSFHIYNNISSHFFLLLCKRVCVSAVSLDQSTLNVCSVSPFCCTFPSKCLLCHWYSSGFLSLNSPHYVFWLQISAFNYARTGIVLPNFSHIVFSTAAKRNDWV